MITTGKVIPRRTVLRGLGVSLALPFLEGMVPAFASGQDAATKPTRRLGVVYVPHGVVMDQWTPRLEGPQVQGQGWKSTPILDPLLAHRQRVLVLTGIHNKAAMPPPGESPAAHSRVSGSFLTGVPMKLIPGAGVELGISMDQVAAGQLGRGIPSLAISLDSTELSGGCEDGVSCASVNTLCWQASTMPLPMENGPQAVFKRLFGQVKPQGTVLDGAKQAVNQLEKAVGPADRRTLTGYLDAVRAVEQRIQKAGQTGVPASFEEYAKIMFDLQVLAYQGDVTRVITFMMGKELSNRSYPEVGVSESHHALSHHQNEPEKLDKLVKINTHHVKLFAYYLDKLQSTSDGAGSLLDQVVIIYGSGMSDGDDHDVTNLPILLVGGGAGWLKPGEHLVYRNQPPLSNLHLAVLNKLGGTLEQFGDSTGELRYLGR